MRHLRTQTLITVAVALLTVCDARPLRGQDVSAAKATAFRVNAALSRYIEVHNDLFAASLQRIVPIPGVFEAIHFTGHVDTLRAIRAALDSAATATRFQLRSIERKSTLHNFLLALDEYVAALDTAVAVLGQISRQLYLKSENPAHYSWDEYDADVGRYRVAIERYISRGARLNALYARLQ